MKSSSAGRGRRAGRPETRELIRAAARRRFLTDGYSHASLRSIAADAGVDVALVGYYFGSKTGLFTAAMSLMINPAEIVQAELKGDLKTLPVRMLRRMLAVWDDPATGGPLVALLTAATSDPAVGRVAAEAVEREIVIPLAERIGGDYALRRAAAFCAQMSGIILSRHVLRVAPIASMPVDEIVATLSPSLARTLRR